MKRIDPQVPARGICRGGLMLTGLWALLFTSMPVHAERISIPMQIDHRVIERALVAQVFRGPRQSLRVNDDGTGCRYMELSKPRVTSRGEHLRVLADAQVRVGTPIGKRCLYALQWDGQVELIERVTLAADAQVHVEVIEENILTRSGERDVVSDNLWSWLRNYVKPAFSVSVVDLGKPLAELRNFLPYLLTPHNSTELQALLDSIQVEGLLVNPHGMLASFGFSVPARASVTPAAPEPMLSEQEIRVFRERLEELDALLTLAIKQSAVQVKDEAALGELLDILLDSRYELVAALNQPVRGGNDPVRRLFTSTWTRLAQVVRRIPFNDGDTLQALNFLTFIAAADMLQSLDALGPGFPIDISVNGLRRLARILVPQEPGELLKYDDKIDPQLRKLFNFTPLDDPELGFTPLLRFSLFPRAHAAGGAPSDVWRRLNNWVPSDKDIDTYLPLANRVLAHAVERRISGSQLDPAYHKLYRALVMATAWQESCWRQFVNVKGQRVPLRSGTGDVGIMQINVRVWRGFYDQHSLQWNIEQNAKAGAEILLHYLEKYSIRKGEHRVTGNIENLARSAYAAYNGGPRQFDRYRKSQAPEYAKKVDALFYEKYRSVRKGNELAVKKCYQ